MSEGSTPMDGTSPTATATGNPNAGMLAPLRDTGLSPLGQSSPSQSYGGADPLAGGIDYRRVWHAFRRRWLPATALALALA